MLALTTTFTVPFAVTTMDRFYPQTGPQTDRMEVCAGCIAHQAGQNVIDTGRTSRIYISARPAR